MVGKAPGGDFDILWEVEVGTQNVFPARQVIIQGLDGVMRAFPILDWMTESDHLLEVLRDRKLEGCTLISVYAKPDERERVSRVVSCLGDASKVTWSLTNWQPQRIPLQVTVQVTDKYFRAVAKIGFHYTLKQFPDLVGNEPEFKLLRQFIRSGGDESPFVRERRDQFVVNFRLGLWPTRWMHILTVERTTNQIISRCQFFAGPHSLPPGYEVFIGHNPARIARPTEKCAHGFVYLDEETTEGYDGIMENLQPAQRVHPVWVVPPFFFSM